MRLLVQGYLTRVEKMGKKQKCDKVDSQLIEGRLGDLHCLHATWKIDGKKKKMIKNQIGKQIKTQRYSRNWWKELECSEPQTECYCKWHHTISLLVLLHEKMKLLIEH